MGRWVGCGMKEWEEYREQRMYDDNERGMSSGLIWIERHEMVLFIGRDLRNE
jgi:hypothetical protein